MAVCLMNSRRFIVILLAPHATSLKLAAQRPQKMLCVHVAGDELGAMSHDLSQNGFAISVNRCHFNQFNDASPRAFCVMCFSPARLEHGRPLAD